jgi:penicillin-binding protein 2
MVKMISAVGTEGLLPTPHLIRGAAGAPRRLDLGAPTYALIRGALREAVRSGTGRAAHLEHVAVAGKTGTAQVFRHSAGVNPDDLPKEERDHGWFVGYAPADDPTIAFAVVVEHGGHGGTSAAPIARQVLEVFFAEDPGSEAETGQLLVRAGGEGGEEGRVRQATHR